MLFALARGEKREKRERGRKKPLSASLFFSLSKLALRSGRLFVRPARVVRSDPFFFEAFPGKTRQKKQGKVKRKHEIENKHAQTHDIKYDKDTRCSFVMH